MSVKRDNPTGYRPTTPARRGKCYGLSGPSRRRLIRRLIGVDWFVCVAYFVTLTYHLDWGEPADWKRDLHAFRRRLERRYGRAIRGVLWRMEPQQRGAPHYHLVIFWRQEPDRRELIRFVSEAWHEVADPSSAAHLRASTRVERVWLDQEHGGMRRLMNYLAKYVGKKGGHNGRWIDQATGEIVATGRVWGVWGDLPVQPLGTVEFRTWEAYARFLRRIRRYGRRSAYLGSLTVKRSAYLLFGGGLELVQLLRGLDVEILHDQDEIASVRAVRRAFSRPWG